MRYIKNTSKDPYFNLALDEYAMKHIDVDEDFFILWQNDPAIIIGKNQNTVQEINQDFVNEKGIKVARRVSGGGAVYHDQGNLNFTFVISVEDPKTVNYKKYVQPIIDALASMGIEAVASGRNDVLVDGLKISGNAQRMANGKLMHHGTILFDVDIETMVQALTVDPEKYRSKGSQSVRSRVTNIKDHLPMGTSLSKFWDQLHYFLSNENKDEEIVLSESDMLAIQKQADEKFSSWDWIYGISPDFDYQQMKRFEGGSLGVHMDVKEGHIKAIRFIGDYLGLEDVSDVEKSLLDSRYDLKDVKDILNQFDLSLYFGLITLNDICEVMF